MEGFKGTRGPWVASKTDRSIGPISKDDDQAYGMILPVAWVEFNGKPEHQEADANLIAAAPELLEALQSLLATQILPDFHAEKFRRVVAKALGQ